MDLLSSHYGWTDDQILDLTLHRIRIAADKIAARMKRERLAHIDLVEAQTRTIAQGFAVMVDKKSRSRFDKWIAAIRFRPEEPSEETGGDTFRGRKLPSAESVMRAFGARR